MVILYHITPKRHLHSILVLGIIPGHKRGICVMGRKTKSVYLTNDTDFILEEQAGEEWVWENSPVILGIDTSTYEVYPAVYDCRNPAVTSEYEFKCDSVISPKHILAMRHVSLDLFH